MNLHKRFTCIHALVLSKVLSNHFYRAFVLKFLKPFVFACVTCDVFFTADDPKSGQYSEDEGWQFITLGDQVR